MKKQGILNAQLAGYIAGLGHTEVFMIGDAGMPVPAGVPLVDLVLTGGIPSFRQVMEAVLQETAVEFYTVAEEMESYNPELLAYIKETLPETDHQMIPQAELKERSKKVKFAIRTGEFTPYANVILQAGVAFAVEKK